MRSHANKSTPIDMRKKSAELVRPIAKSSAKITEVWTPEDFAAHLPDAPLATSRGKAPWDDIVVEHRMQLPQELDAAPMTHHLLGLVLGPPAFHFWRDIDGDVNEGLRVPGSTPIIPAGRPRRARWDKTSNLLHISLSPTLLERVAEPFIADRK